MKIYISGSHTAPYGDFPYDKFYEFERALNNEWDAIERISPDSISGAEIEINENKVADMTVRQILKRLEGAVHDASYAVNWGIWLVFLPK